MFVTGSLLSSLGLTIGLYFLHRLGRVHAIHLSHQVLQQLLELLGTFYSDLLDRLDLGELFGGLFVLLHVRLDAVGA